MIDLAQPVLGQPVQRAPAPPELEFESVPRLGPGLILLRILMVLALFAVLCLVATIPLEWKDQALFGGGLLIFAAILSKKSKAHSVTLFLAFLSMFSTVRYAYWRFSATYNYLAFNWAEARTLDLIFVFILLGAESYAFLILFLGFFQTARPLNRRPIPLPEDPDLWPSVDLYIPTYNEPLDVVRATVLAALNIDWPQEKLHVYVLDDGRRDEFREFSESCGAGYIIRPDNKHAKAGNINHALKKTTSEYVTIFDCDHIPTRSYLQITMGWLLKDPRLAMVQTPHHFYSPDPFERNLNTFRKVPNEGALFYGVIQDGSDLWNATFFCGSCAVIRRTALEEVGGVAVETVTEDAHTSLRMQRRGWNTAYLRFPQAGGLATGSLAAHIGQRIRWARGMIQILRTDNPLFGKGLKLHQRLCYLNSMLHFLYAAPRLIFLTSPLVYLLFGYSNIYGYSRAILAYAFPHLAFSVIANSRVQGLYRHSFWNEIYEAVLAPFILLPTAVALISPKHGKFNVTSKGDMVDDTYFDWRLAWPYLALLVPNMIGMTLGIFKMIAVPELRGTLLVNVLWSFLNVIVLGATTAVARESKQRRTSVRIASSIPLRLELQDGRVLETETIDVSRGGVSVRVPKGFRVAFGEKAKAIFPTVEGDYDFSLIAIDADQGIGRFNLNTLSLQDEERLVRVIFGRADSWLHWRDMSKGDRPLLSFVFIVGIALEGIAAVPLAVVDLFRRSTSSTKNTKTAVQNPVLPLIAWIALGIGLLASPVFERSLQAAPVDEPTFTDNYNLAALGQKSALFFHGVEARTSLNFGVPITKVTNQAAVRLDYRASPALAAGVSVVHVLLNGSRVGSAPIVQSGEPEALTSTTIDLPSDLLTSDNTLTFEFEGKCVPGCNGGEPADLWLRLEPTTRIRLSGSLMTLSNDLRLLPAPFFDRSSQRRVVAPIAFLEQPDGPSLEAAGVIASWLGILADFRNLHFPVNIGSIPPGNVIVFARSDSKLLANLGLEGNAGPGLALRTNPSDPTGKVLIIIGNDGKQVLAAARALALGSYSKSGDYVQVTDTQLPPSRRPYDAPRWLSTEHSTPLGETLNVEDLHVYGNGSVKLYFRLPPDLYFGSRLYAPLRLAYQTAKWAPGTEAQMRVHLNGSLISSRKISKAADGNRHVESFALPRIALTPNNTITVEFEFTAGLTPDSQATPEVRVLPDSVVDLAGLTHFVEMPRLDLFANSGFPFTRFADLSATAAVLDADCTPEQISFYLATLGLFGSHTGYPALRINVLRPDQTAAADTKHLVIVGSATAARMLGSWRPAEGLARMEDGRVKLSVPSVPWYSWGRDTRDRDIIAEVLSADPPANGFLQEFVSPIGVKRTAIVLDAADPGQLEAFENVFAGASGVANVHGSVSILQGGRFHSVDFKSNAYGIGDLPWLESFRVWSSRHYWLIPLLIIPCGLLFAAWIGRWLEDRARFRLMGGA